MLAGKAAVVIYRVLERSVLCFLYFMQGFLITRAYLLLLRDQLEMTTFSYSWLQPNKKNVSSTHSHCCPSHREFA